MYPVIIETNLKITHFEKTSQKILKLQLLRHVYQGGLEKANKNTDFTQACLLHKYWGH